MAPSILSPWGPSMAPGPPVSLVLGAGPRPVVGAALLVRTPTRKGLAHSVPSQVPSKAPEPLVEALRSTPPCGPQDGRYSPTASWARDSCLPLTLPGCAWRGDHALAVGHPAGAHGSPFFCNTDPAAVQEREGLCLDFH